MALFDGYILNDSIAKTGITSGNAGYAGIDVLDKTGITPGIAGYLVGDETFLQGSTSPNNLARVSLSLSSSQIDSPVVVTGNVGLSLGSKQGVTITPVAWDPTPTSPSVTLSNSNLTATNNISNYHPARADVGRSSGKHVFEIEIGTSSSAISVGLSAGGPFTTSAFSLGSSTATGISSLGKRTTSTQFHENGVSIGTTSSFPANIAGDIIQVRVDFDSKQISINLYRPSTQTFLTTDGFINFTLNTSLFPSAAVFTAGRSITLRASASDLLAPYDGYEPWDMALTGAAIATEEKGLSLSYLLETSLASQGLSALTLSSLQQAAVILQADKAITLSALQQAAVILQADKAITLSSLQQAAVILQANKAITLASVQENSVSTFADRSLSLAYTQEIQSLVTAYKGLSLASVQESDDITSRSWRILFDSKNPSLNNNVVIRDVKFYKDGVQQTGSGGLQTFGSTGFPDSAFDVSLLSLWDSGTAPIAGQYIGRDFGASINFDEIRIISSPNGSPNTFRIQYSDDPNPATATDWQTHWTLSNITDWEQENSFTGDLTGGSLGISLAYTMAQEDTAGGGRGLTLSSAIEEQLINPNTYGPLSDSFTINFSSLETFNVFKLRDSFSIVGDEIKGPLNTFAGLQSAMAMNDLLNLGFLAEIRENITLSDNPQALIYLISRISEEISLNDTSLTTAEIVGSMVDAFTLAEILLAGQVGDLSDSIVLNSDVTHILKAFGEIQEQLTLHFEQGLGTAVHVFGKLAENIALDDNLTGAALLKAMLTDGMSLITLPTEFGDVEGVRTGWVMNPETFSIWNYENMNFNSLTYYEQQGLMASSKGLFKSNDSAEDTLTLDPTANPTLVSRITSSLKTASIDFGTSSLKQVPQMYLGLDMDGEVTLVVNTDERVKVRYKLIKPSTHTHVQDLKIGKGLIGSQWQFELIDCTSDNLELNFIEILPIVFGRKTR